MAFYVVIITIFRVGGGSAYEPGSESGSKSRSEV